MRTFFHAVLLGTLLCALNYAGVLAGMLAPPPGYVPAHFIRNLDVPQYLTWAALSRQHWLLPDFHAPWLTEPALFQPMFWIVGHALLPAAVSYYLFQIVLSWLAALALLQAAETFCETRRQRLYSLAVVVCSVPLLMYGWVAAKALDWSSELRTFLGLGVVQYAYDTADGLVRGGLANSITLTFGTTMTLFAFTNLARYIKEGQRRHYLWLIACVFLDGLLHPFEIFLIAAAAVWPLWRAGRKHAIPVLFAAAAAGMSPYVVQTVRSGWVRDASDLAQWHMGSPAWVVLAYGIPAAMVCWLMLMRFRVARPEDGVLQCWFLGACLLPMIPAIPVAIHLFDGFVYCLGFLLVRKATQDRLISRLFAQRPRAMHFALAGWVLVSAATLATMYAQVWKDGKSPAPDLFLSAVAPVDEVRMIDWMRASLPHPGVQRDLVLAPPSMAPWVATIPMPSFASHDLFSISYNAQQDLAERFYKGENLRRDLIDHFGVSYVIVPVSMQLDLEDVSLIHQEASLRLYHIPNQHMRPYPGAANIAGSAPKNALRQWILRLLTAMAPSSTRWDLPRG